MRTPPFQRVHYRLVGGYLWIFHHAATRVLGLRVEVEGPDPDEYLGRPLLVFCRHAGPGDSFLLMHALVNWYAREPRIVLAAALQWDPGDRRRAQPPAEPVPVDRRTRRRAADRRSWRRRSTATTRS